MKRVEIDGKFYRKRRGKLVEIPEQWVGKTSSAQTIRKRQSKIPPKIKGVHKLMKRGLNTNYFEMKYFDEKYVKIKAISAESKQHFSQQYQQSNNLIK